MATPDETTQAGKTFRDNIRDRAPAMAHHRPREGKHSCLPEDEVQGGNQSMYYWNCKHCGQRTRCIRKLDGARMWYFYGLEACTKDDKAPEDPSEGVHEIHVQPPKSLAARAAPFSHQEGDPDSQVMYVNITAPGPNCAEEVKPLVEAIWQLTRNVHVLGLRLGDQDAHVVNSFRVLEERMFCLEEQVRDLLGDLRDGEAAVQFCRPPPPPHLQAQMQ
jgi:hypothetical protein